MKNFFLLVIFLFISNYVNSNEVEVIELHENKSLDQMVIEQINQDSSENNNEEQNDINEQVESDINNENTNNNLVSDDIVVEEKSIDENSILIASSESDIATYLLNLNNLKSNILQNEISNFLQKLDLDYNDKKNRDIFFYIVNYFYNIGNISNSYKLIQTRDLSADENSAFYTTVKINYLLSTFQLENVCNIKNDLSINLNLKNYLLEKIDIFCSVLEGNISEAELLNSILQETEEDTDLNFQQLYMIISGKEIESNNNVDLKNINKKDLIFLYSAMARIAELPLSENFLSVDPKNLSIPIILNKSSPIDLRIQAANLSYLNNTISIDSLAALYQSVDFSSSQFNDPEETILGLAQNIEIIMSYYFQLINVQIFPSERIDALVKFWDFAKNHDLEQIAYSLSYKIIESIELTAENLKYSNQIATSYIYNKDYEKALEWVSFYENSSQIDEKSSYVRILLNLYSSTDINSVVEIISSNFEKFNNIDSKKNEELIFTLLDILGKINEKKITQNFDQIYDNRLMPSVFIIENIKDSINNKNDSKFLFFSGISLNNKNWNEIHPEHLKLILSGYLNYDGGKLIKEIIIELFKNYKIL